MSAYAVSIVQGRIVGRTTHGCCPTVTAIQAEVIREFGLPRDAMTTRRRPEWIAWPRQIAMGLAYELTSLDSNQVACYFGDRSHGAVLHAWHVMQNREATNAHTRAQIDALRERLA